jgi:hypothetical protein
VDAVGSDVHSDAEACFAHTDKDGIFVSDSDANDCPSDVALTHMSFDECPKAGEGGFRYRVGRDFGSHRHILSITLNRACNRS